MEEIIDKFRSPATSLSQTSSTMNSKSSSGDTELTDGPCMTTKTELTKFESLPSEIIGHILAFLPPVSLVDLSCTSKHLRSHALNDLLWLDFIRQNVPTKSDLEPSSPAISWRQLYIAHHPYWFLARHKIWFADVPNTGKLVLARYSYRRGCLEAYQLVAEHGAHSYEYWTHNSDVIIHAFNPRVRLWIDDPVINLEIKKAGHEKRLQKEIAMHTGSTHGICSMISLCQSIPKPLQDPSMALWPPAIVPSKQRVRNESPNKFRTEAHRPHSLHVMSDQTFRIRKWLEFSNLMQPLSSVRMGEEVMTFSTLLPESYTPTKEKPYQGIWVGDYSAHGCEFLLVLQGEVSSRMSITREARTSILPEGVSMTQMEVEIVEDETSRERDVGTWEDNEGETRPHQQGEAAGPSMTISERMHMPKSTYTEIPASSESATEGSHSSGNFPINDNDTGRLEATKLTGDINVPRGQYTWIAEDIGPNGLIRIGKEQMFDGARIVKSWGRVAGRGFKHDRFVPTQLILISHDTVAQYWEDFGHISFYKRVNIDDYLDADDVGESLDVPQGTN